MRKGLSVAQIVKIVRKKITHMKREVKK